MYCGLYSECPLREVPLTITLTAWGLHTCIRLELRQYLNNLDIFASGNNDVSIYLEGIGMNNK